MSELPTNWVATSFGELGRLHCGQSPAVRDVNQEGVGTPYVTGPEQWDGEAFRNPKWTTTPKRIVPDGCVFITVKGAGVGKTFPGVACAIGRDVYAFQPAAGLDFNFILRAIQNRAMEIISDARGDIPGLSKSHIEDHEAWLPPLPEQRRIVAKLDRLSTRTKAARAHLARMQSLASRAKQAILDSAFAHEWPTGELREFVDPERGIPYGIVQTGNHTPGGVPTVRCGDIKRFSVSPDALKCVEPQVSAAYRRTVLRGGEVLIAIRGSVGETCVVPPSMAGCNISREVALIPVLEGIDAKFIMFFLQSRTATRFVKANIKGVAQSGINLRDLRTLPTPRLAGDVQTELVRHIEAAFARIDRMVEEATRAAHLLDRLDQRLLAKAFRGELVPQDPNDEPAAELLARIHAARATTPKQRRSKKAAT